MTPGTIWSNILQVTQRNWFRGFCQRNEWHIWVIHASCFTHMLQESGLCICVKSQVTLLKSPQDSKISRLVALLNAAAGLFFQQKGFWKDVPRQGSMDTTKRALWQLVFQYVPWQGRTHTSKQDFKSRCSENTCPQQGQAKSDLSGSQRWWQETSLTPVMATGTGAEWIHCVIATQIQSTREVEVYQCWGCNPFRG